LSSEAEFGRAGRWPTLAVLAAVILHLGLFAAAVGRGTVVQPFSDMFDLVSRWLQHRERGGLLAYLLDPHNFHRLAYTRALVALDMGVLHGSGWVFVAVAALCLLAGAALTASQVWRQVSPPLRLPAAAVAAMLVLSTVNALDVVFPIDTPYAEAFVLSLAAMIASGDRRPWVAPLLAMLAAFANAIALVLWPVLIFSAWRTRAGARTLAILFAVGAVFIGLYAWGQTDPPSPPTSILKRLHYALVWLGLPWSTRLGGPLIGLVLLLVSLRLLATRGGPKASRLEQLSSRLILFSLGGAAMAALGRAGFEPEVPMRYALFLTPLHLGLFCMALPLLQRRGTAPVLAALIGLLLLQQAFGAIKLVAVADQIRQALADFAAGRDTPMVKVFVHPDPNRARAVLARMEAETGRRPLP
jgi:hypothetical protein